MPGKVKAGKIFSLSAGTLDNLPVKSTSCPFYLSARSGSAKLTSYRDERRKKFVNRSLLGGSYEVPSQQPLNDIPTFEYSTARADTFIGHEDSDASRQINTVDLPVHAQKNAFISSVRENQVVIVIGETGSGKTTQLPQFLHQAGFSKNGIIGCTQPRRAAAVSISQRVSKELQCRNGDLVGYAVRFEDCTSSLTRIKYMTDGVLRRECVQGMANYLAKYSVIILDEAHERSLNTDMLLGCLQKILQVRKDFRLIISSATIQSAEFSVLFPGAHTLRIPGRTHEVKIVHSPTNVDDYVEQAVSTVIRVHTTESLPGDILVFMTGQEDVQCTAHYIREMLEKYSPSFSKNLIIRTIYSLLSSSEQSEIFQATPKGYRRCVVATNIAETSLTIDGIRYVVDCGFVKIKVYRPSLGLNTLEVYPISKAQANQRSGRAGRTCPGTCYRLYTKQQLENEMLASSMPEVERTNLSNVVLNVKALGFTDICDFPLITQPKSQLVANATALLWMMNAIDENGSLTALGKDVLEYPTDVYLSIFIVKSIDFGCSREAVMIASLLSVEYRRILDFSIAPDEIKHTQLDKFRICGSDHLTLLNIYEHYLRNSTNMEWLKQHNISMHIMRKVEKIDKQLCEILARRKVKVESCGNNLEQVRKALAHSYYINSARQTGILEFMPILFARIPFKTQQSSSIRLSSCAEYVIYHELIETNCDRKSISIVTEVDPIWIIHEKPELFNVYNAEKKLDLSGSSQHSETSNVKTAHQHHAVNESSSGVDQGTITSKRALEYQKPTNRPKLKYMKSKFVEP